MMSYIVYDQQVTGYWLILIHCFHIAAYTINEDMQTEGGLALSDMMANTLDGKKDKADMNNVSEARINSPRILQNIFVMFQFDQKQPNRTYKFERVKHVESNRFNLFYYFYYFSSSFLYIQHTW